MANTVMISVRLRPEDRRLLEQVCRARREDISSFVRRAIAKELAALSFLSEDEKKALGVNQGGNHL